MKIHKTIYGEELYKLLSVIDVEKFLKERNINISDFAWVRYGFKNGIEGFRIELLDKDEVMESLKPEIASQLEFQLITFMFATDIIITL